MEMYVMVIWAFRWNFINPLAGFLREIQFFGFLGGFFRLGEIFRLDENFNNFFELFFLQSGFIAQNTYLMT